MTTISLDKLRRTGRLTKYGKAPYSNLSLVMARINNIRKANPFLEESCLLNNILSYLSLVESSSFLSSSFAFIQSAEGTNMIQSERKGQLPSLVFSEKPA